MIAIESLVRTLIGVGVTLLAGCAGTVIVDYSVDADVGILLERDGAATNHLQSRGGKLSARVGDFLRARIVCEVIGFNVD